MPSIDEIYQQLTGVNIDEQKLLWDERGKGYYGEYLVFKELYRYLPGCCKILMNLQVPAGDGKTTEIDLLLIHETGLYVVEVKHYKGTIYGKPNDQKWTQYFRTSPNSHFYNPVLQNQYHLSALKRMYPEIPIHSYIVFTSPNCDLRVACAEPDITVCLLQNLHIPLCALETRNKIFDTKRIDEIFNELCIFSPITATPIVVDTQSVPFHQYINTIIKDFNDEKNNLKNNYLAAKKTERQKTHVTIILSVITVVVCIALSITVCFLYRTYANGQISDAKQELNEFAQKFELVEDFNNGEIVIAKDIVTSSNIMLEESIDIENAVSFSCSLTWNGSDYGVNIGKDAVLIAILKDGSIKECPVYNSIYPYTSDYRLGISNNVWYSAHSSGDILRHEFYDVAIDDISYIKLSNLDIWTDINNRPTIISSNFEIELYQAE